MRILITGVAGFVGRYAAREFLSAGHSIIGFDRTPIPDPPCPLATGDIRDLSLLREIVRQFRPDAGLHLAALAFPPGAEADPALMADVNVLGTVHLCEAFRREAPQARLLFVSTARVYGSRESSTPLTEDSSLNPDSFYAATKASADLLTLRYAHDWGCPFLIARPHNHTGPGQADCYVIPSLIRQVLTAAQKGEKVATLRVGNIASRRDFLDVRDVVSAYRHLLEKGVPGRAYNIASGQIRSIGEIIEIISKLANVHLVLESDPALTRPTDSSAPLDISRLRQDTGWEPRIPFEQTLREMLNVRSV